MIWICRPTVLVDFEIEAAKLDATFVLIVTAFAQTLQRTRSKEVPAAMVRQDVISDGRDRSNSLA